MSFFINLMAMHRKPFYVIAGVFPGDMDLSWIPDAGFSLPLHAAAEEADGSRTGFTFGSAPVAVMYNGVWYLENHGFTRSGFVVTFRDADGNVFAPESGAVIRAIY